jgi:multidrug efflux pump subunit AcrA (membrane-fusion protein)
MRKRTWVLLIVATLVLAGTVTWLVRRPNSQASFAAVERGDIVESVYGIGVLTAVRSLTIKSGVITNIRQLFVTEGQVVKKNDLLVELESIGRYRAPFAGTVTASPYKTGETVYPQTSVVTLTDPTETYLLVTLEQQGALSLKSGLNAKVSFDGMRGRTFDGKVDSVFSNGVDFLAHISVAALPASLLPGMTADVAIILRTKQDVLLLPLASLSLSQASLVRNGKTVQVPVKLGLVDGAFAEVLEGDVHEGDLTVQIKSTKK